MRVLVGDTEDMRSSREGSGGLCPGTDMLELEGRVGRAVMTLPAPHLVTHLAPNWTRVLSHP